MIRRDKRLLLFLSLGLILVLTAYNFLSNTTNYDEYGGWKKIRGTKTEFFHVENINGIWWFVDPEGYVFISKGVNHVDYHGDYSPALGYSPYFRNIKKRYGDVHLWVVETASRLRQWGFNTIGAWSSKEFFDKMPFTLILDIAASYGANWLTGKVPDIFSDDFEQHAKARALSLCSPLKNSKLLIGYFTDNELRWGPDWRSPNHLLDDFIKLPANSPGKKVAVETLMEVFKDINALNAMLNTSFTDFNELLNYTGDLPKGELFDNARSLFLIKYAKRYFSVCYRAIKEADPNHLILGCRFAGYAPPEVLKVIKDYVDVISINYYDHKPPIDYLRYIYVITKKPILLTEFSFKAMDSGLPNTKGAGTPVATQKERAELAKEFIKELVSQPFIIGYHWFQYMDQPKEGRFDGENSNFGLVKINDEPWKELIRALKEINMRAEKIHLASVSK